MTLETVKRYIENLKEKGRLDELKAYGEALERQAKTSENAAKRLELFKAQTSSKDKKK